jgi:hypothetical protein
MSFLFLCPKVITNFKHGLKLLSVFSVQHSTLFTFQVLVESLQSHCIYTQFHWSSGPPVCFPSWGTQVQSPGGVLKWNRDSPVSIVLLHWWTRRDWSLWPHLRQASSQTVIKEPDVLRVPPSPLNVHLHSVKVFVSVLHMIRNCIKPFKIGSGAFTTRLYFLGRKQWGHL